MFIQGISTAGQSPRRSLSQGQVLLADRAYDSDALRERLAKQGAWGNIRLMPNRVRLPEFCPTLYRERHFVERFFNNPPSGLLRKLGVTHKKSPEAPEGERRQTACQCDRGLTWQGFVEHWFDQR